jgi:hypothetical protein
MRMTFCDEGAGAIRMSLTNVPSDGSWHSFQVEMTTADSDGRIAAEPAGRN